MLHACSKLSPAVRRVALRANARTYKVAVLGAAGGIGQPMSLLLKLNPLVTQLSCYDVAAVTPGVGVDLAHCSSNAKCVGYGAEDLDACLEGCDIVVIPAGVPRKPGMTRDDLFHTNATIVRTLAEGVAKNCPDACTLIISNPVNSTVPICREIFKAAGTYNPKKLFGVTQLDVTRARTFVAEAKDLDVHDVDVPVVGGHAGETIVPLLSQTSPELEFTDEERDALTHRIMFGGDEVVEAKAGGGSATLSMAFAGAEFANAVMHGLDGELGVVACCFVESDVTEAEFFASPVTLGLEGVETVHGYGEVTEYEAALIADMLPDLQAQAAKGVAFTQ